jgi:hypothetical protein
MPLLQEPTNQKTNQTENCGFETNPNKTNPSPKKEDSSIIKTIGQLLPLAPFVFEQFTGQKIPAMSGTMAEIQLALTNLQTGLQTVVNNQQTLNQRITNLENSAVQQLTNLTHQFNSLRLTHTQEKKQIEFNPNPNQINEDY